MANSTQILGQWDDYFPDLLVQEQGGVFTLRGISLADPLCRESGSDEYDYNVDVGSDDSQFEVFANVAPFTDWISGNSDYSRCLIGKNFAGSFSILLSY